ncbi:hypothetical protein [Paraburkholderia fungorum]|uniref:hypothetical protein n=1 Tax=Paraburkholderia fungorum TaxID=134537 RepID=UPI001617487A|nr:hypothetical protein [Paraburkholderia fungorum]MBB5546614.1 hypothetical protein [Paraburkholderia fungorum]
MQSSSQSTLPGHLVDIFRAFLTGINIARCDVDEDAEGVSVQFGRQTLNDGYPALSLPRAEALSIFALLYNRYAPSSTPHSPWSSHLRQTAKLRATIDRCQIDLWYANLPTDNGYTVVLGNLATGGLLFEQEVANAEAGYLGDGALDSFATWCAENETFLARGKRYGYRIAVSPELKDAIERRLDVDTAARVNAHLLNADT